MDHASGQTAGDAAAAGPTAGGATAGGRTAGGATAGRLTARYAAPGDLGAAPGPSRRRYLGALLVLLVVLVGVAWVAGQQSLRGAPAGAKSLDAERLGPEAGQPVAEYLVALPARLPPPGAPPVPALIQLTAGLDGPAAAALLAAPELDAGMRAPGIGPGTSASDTGHPPVPGTSASDTGHPPVPGAASMTAGTPPVASAVTAVLRVPLPRVQTALRFQPLAPVTDPDPIAGLRRRVALAQTAAQRAAAADAARLTGRRAQVAAAEAIALSRPDCRCVLAVLVRADRAGLESLAARPGVRAVDAAPEGTPDDGVALAPLLPEQTAEAGPVPDDGPVPPR